MHPLHSELTARMITEDRLRRAEIRRRLQARTPARPAVRDRLGAGLIRLGTRLQHRPPTTAAHAAPC